MVRTERQDRAHGWILRWALALAISAAAFFLSAAPSQAQPVTYGSYAEAQAQLSTDLRGALTSSSVSGISWARESAGGRLVKVLVIAAPGVDPDLSQLRKAITQAGNTPPHLL